jgi:SAM-dependent methyltransferase
VREGFAGVPLDASIPQDEIDLTRRSRTNLFPWRGQFSPDLARLLLSHYARRGSAILDPFAGVGTTLIEAGRLGLRAFGTEINPAAFTMAETVRFNPLPVAERRAKLDSAKKLLPRSANPERLAAVAKRHLADPAVFNILANTLLRFDKTSLVRAFGAHAGVVLELPESRLDCLAFNADARAIPLADRSVDAILTSPPYINVFNYHQNHRRAMELLGWDLLAVAKSEIGSNRKHRGNRFLTVVQYCLDMAEAFAEWRRVLRRDGLAIVVIGRESNVRGVSFRNGELVAEVARFSGYALEGRQERKFKNKFGKIICEDILRLRKLAGASRPNGEGVRGVAEAALQQAFDEASSDEVRGDVRDALDQLTIVRPSARYSRNHHVPR